MGYTKACFDFWVSTYSIITWMTVFSNSECMPLTEFKTNNYLQCAISKRYIAKLDVSVQTAFIFCKLEHPYLIYSGKSNQIDLF